MPLVVVGAVRQLVPQSASGIMPLAVEKELPELLEVHCQWQSNQLQVVEQVLPTVIPNVLLEVITNVLIIR